MKHILLNTNRFCVAISILLLFASCVKEPFEPGLGEGSTWVDFSFGAENEVVLTTKAHQSYASENRIADIFVFIFDASGNKIYDAYFSSSNIVQKGQFDNAANKARECWYVENASTSANQTQGKFRIKAPLGTGLSIYCASNLDSDRTHISSALLSRTVNNFSDLQNFKLFLNVDSIERNDKFSSLGFLSGVKIESKKITYTAGNEILLKRVDAKVKFTFKTGTRPDKNNGQVVKTFTPETWKVVNVPRNAYLIERANEDASTPPSTTSPSSEAYAPYAADYFDTDWRQFETATSNTENSFAFYMLENRLPSKKTITDYQQRSKRAKNALGANLSTEVTYTENNGQIVTKDIPNFEFANDFSTYVLVRGRVEMELTNDDAGQMLGANVEYMIHLGGLWTSDIKNGTGKHWDDDVYGGSIGSFDVERNNSYNYIVTINSVDNIRIEVETSQIGKEFKENQPGAWGLVTIAKEEIAVCDAHYVSKTLSFHVDNLVQGGYSIGDKLTWAINTPFSEFKNKEYKNEEETPLSEFDYKWVHFRLNKKDVHGQYFEDKRRKFITRPFATSETMRSGSDNKEGDGTTDGLGGYHNDGLMDVVDLVQYIKEQSELYAQFIRGEIPDRVDAFDLGSPTESPKISITVFVDEYYYESNPLTGTTSNTLWKRFVNVDDRYLHILSDSKASQDGDSRTTGSVVTIQQKSIQSIYNIDEANEGLVRAWGLEHLDEHADIWQWGDLHCNGNTDNQNGYINTMKLWDLCDAGNTNFKGDRKWITYMDIEVNNDTPQLKADGTHNRLRYSCMTRNRDNNGNGVIDKDEMRWYTASIGQLVNLYMGESCISASSRLYNRDADTRHAKDAEVDRGDGTKVRLWMQHVISSTKHSSDNPILVWAEEGVATGAATNGIDEGASSWMTVRCCRNLGMDTDDDMTTIAERIIQTDTRTEGGHTYVVFDSKNLMPASKRDYISSEMPMHFETSSINLIYDKFEVYYENSSTGGKNQFVNYNEEVNKRLKEGTSLFCPDGWRTPNQKEVATMVYFTDMLTGALKLDANSMLSRTAWSMGRYQLVPEFQTDASLNKNDKPGFVYNSSYSIITLNDASVNLRCVRDVRVK